MFAKLTFLELAPGEWDVKGMGRNKKFVDMNEQLLSTSSEPIG